MKVIAMTRWLGLFLLLPRLLHAQVICDGTTSTEGATCVMSDAVTQGICNGGTCIRTYTIPGNGPRTGTGTISSSGATVTGSGTVFMTELHVGDVLTMGGQRVAINAIASDTSLTTDPAFGPAASAASFTYTNPIVRWLDESGNTVAILDSSGLVAFGQAWANGPLTIIGRAETGVGVVGKSISITPGIGGPAGGGFVGGNGGVSYFRGGDGGSSSSASLSSGAGSAAVLIGGSSGVNTGGGPLGGSGDAVVVGGDSPSISSAGGRAIIRGAGATGAYGDVLICDNGSFGTSYTAKFGRTPGLFTVNCLNGDITKIKNVPVAGLWNVNAFQQANAGGM